MAVTNVKEGSSAEACDIPKTCIGAVVKNEGPDFYVEIETLDVPEIKPDEVLLKMNATGLCLSDIHYMMNDWHMAAMSTMGTKCAGHEGVGVIVKVGENVSRVKVGQRAGCKPIADVCHKCEHCRAGEENYCQDFILSGFHVEGSYKQYVALPERYLTLIPDEVHDYVAGSLMCSASTVYTSLKDSGIKAGQWACFIGGGGGVGIQGVQLAVALGIRPIVVDTGEERRKLSISLGAEHFVDFKECDAVKEVVKLTGGIGAHGVFVTAVQSYPTSPQFLGTRKGGVVMGIGLPPVGKYHIDLDITPLVFRNQCIKGTLVSTLTETDEVLDFAARGKLRLEPQVVGLSQFNEAVQKLKNGQVAGRMVVDFNIP